MEYSKHSAGNLRTLMETYKKIEDPVDRLKACEPIYKEMKCRAIRSAAIRKIKPNFPSLASFVE